MHLSADDESAISVGRRHSRPVILKIDTQAMHHNHHPFYCSKNDVWLTDQVPVKYILNRTELSEIILQI